MEVDIQGTDKQGEGWRVKEQGKNMFCGTNKMQKVSEGIVWFCH